MLLPGTAFLEMALEAGRQAGCGEVEELALQAPLALPEHGAHAIQLRLGAPEEEGRREIAIHSRPEGEPEAEWELHAQGLIAPGVAEPCEPLPSWPPEGAEPLALDDLYERLADHGFEYGEAFQNLDAAWSAGEEIYAEVSLSPESAPEASRFNFHPALVDAAFHAGLGRLLEEEEGSLALPFLWRGVRGGSPGATALRVRLAPTGEERSLSLVAFDESGAELLGVESVLAREVDAAALRAASRARDPLYELAWRELATTGDPGETTEVELFDADDLEIGDPADPAARTHAATQAALALVKERLASWKSGSERLVLLTADAVSTAARGERRPRHREPLRAAALGRLRAPRPLRPIDTRRHGRLGQGAAAALALTGRLSPRSPCARAASSSPASPPRQARAGADAHRPRPRPHRPDHRRHRRPRRARRPPPGRRARRPPPAAGQPPRPDAPGADELRRRARGAGRRGRRSPPATSPTATSSQALLDGDRPPTTRSARSSTPPACSTTA